MTNKEILKYIDLDKERQQVLKDFSDEIPTPSGFADYKEFHDKINAYQDSKYSNVYFDFSYYDCTVHYKLLVKENDKDVVNRIRKDQVRIKEIRIENAKK